MLPDLSVDSSSAEQPQLAELDKHVGGSQKPASWPPKFALFGVQVTATDYDEAVQSILGAARTRASAIVSTQAVHPIVMASSDASLRAKVNTFEMLCPDGQPVKWALNWLHNTRLTDRVYGPELTLRLCAAAAGEHLKVYFYGSTDDVLRQLRERLLRQFEGLQVVGTYAPPFRSLTPDEDADIVDRINCSGANLVFIGLGAPKQDLFSYEHRHSLRGVQVCVGAAFDFLAGNKQMAPSWMQRNGLEWLYRLVREPRRLWRRYLFTNSIFLLKLLAALIKPAARASTTPALASSTESVA